MNILHLSCIDSLQGALHIFTEMPGDAKESHYFHQEKKARISVGGQEVGHTHVHGEQMCSEKSPLL
jgi:hypothetical protein